MKPLILTKFTLTCALGRGVAEVAGTLANRNSGLHPCDFEPVDLETYIGRVNGIEQAPVVDPLAAFDCRNNRLAQLALQQDNFQEAVEDARRRSSVTGNFRSSSRDRISCPTTPLAPTIPTFIAPSPRSCRRSSRAAARR